MTVYMDDSWTPVTVHEGPGRHAPRRGADAQDSAGYAGMEPGR
jgi:hypothetical protein